ncbi:hypothetical protein A2U01_0059133, partial [Trifolium medium]|nr:hypothetical protein [Trifolium medium]
NYQEAKQVGEISNMVFLRLATWLLVGNKAGCGVLFVGVENGWVDSPNL